MERVMDGLFSCSVMNENGVASKNNSARQPSLLVAQFISVYVGLLKLGRAGWVSLPQSRQ
jgi:hypothetical protein